ncbi:MAG: efflux RND transporter permease subunit [Akkermansiaceae bacterium]|nr:efflux RND transporter permease subunit [Akkermansiaceae bacterium]MCP5546430.1 efflux RND transporter permease subunit [Akkermansiaceae bacterium]
MNEKGHPGPGIAGRVAAAFIDSKLTPLVVVASILLGVAAVFLLPREEEPQIKVPMIDVMVAMPGSNAKEVEERVTRPMERLIWEIPGVEYVYSTSRDSESLVIVRFKVGEDPDVSLGKLTEKLRSYFDRIPMGASMPLVKPRSIDDVPILALTFHSDRYDHLTLRRVAAQVEEEVKAVNLVAGTQLIGGSHRQIRVLVDPVKLAARRLTLADLAPMLQQSNRQFRAGGLTTDGTEVLIETGAFLTNIEDVGNVVAGVFDGRPVYLREIAEIRDDGEEPSQYVMHGAGPAGGGAGPMEPAVTLTVAKRPGANAISVATEVLEKVDSLKGRIIPRDIDVSITRHYGETAAEKSNELLLHMGIAVVSVAILIWLSLGWRESGIVGIAIPATLALTLLVFYLHGFTLNRITLFALIFSIGILVDDAIVVVENIVRHFHLPESKGRPWSKIAVEAVGEVGNPTILATFAVIAAVLPMAFVGGLMGPYMRPIPIGASAAMFWSLLIAFIVTPWASIRILKIGKKYSQLTAPGTPADAAAHSAHDHPEDVFTRLYRHVMGPLIHHVVWRWVFLIAITVLLLAAMATVGVGWVKVKMLPFDNKSEFQVILNMPEGSPLEETARVAREMARVIREEPEVADCQLYAGTASPFNFNGLVRHYFMRSGPHVADIQVNLAGKHDRDAQSHDIAKRVRPALAEIAGRYGARVAVAEVPPGPPVLQTLVAEIYGPSDEARLKLAGEVKRIFHETPGVVDVDWYVEADQRKDRFVIDKEKAALHGINAAELSRTLKIAVDGEDVDLLHEPDEKEDVPIRLEIPRSAKTHPQELLALRVGRDSVPLGELAHIEEVGVEKSRYRKNLVPVTYVIGDVAGVVESPVYAIFEMNRRLRELDTREFGGSGAELRIHNAKQPFTTHDPAIKWDGEWHITIEVFRDLGAAFAACLVLIYVLMVGWFRSFITPLIVMVAIPFSLVGILPAHGALGAFFTATSMIGFMAGGGIVVRNSIILVDFIEQRIREGMPIDEAVIDAGAVRFRPMLLTALAVVVGAAVILADPIFQGLAIALMAGEIASLFISRMAVPVLYYMANKRLHLSPNPSKS